MNCHPISSKEISDDSNAYNNASSFLKEDNSSSESETLSSTILSTSNSVDFENTENEENSSLSPWFEWYLKKELERRESLKFKDDNNQKVPEVEPKLKDPSMIETEVKVWLERKLKQMKEKTEAKLMLEKKLEDNKMKKIEIHQQSEENFKIWKRNKLKTLKEKQNHMANFEKEKEMKLEERKLVSEEAYKEWLQAKLFHKLSRKKISYALIEGILTEYYDLTSLPTPTFVNPVGWDRTALKCPRKKELERQQIEEVFPPKVWELLLSTNGTNNLQTRPKPKLK